MILTYIRECMCNYFVAGFTLTALDDITSRISCVTALAVSVAESDTRIGPTLMVVIAALVCEYCGKIATSPLALLQGIASRLVSYGGTYEMCFESLDVYSGSSSYSSRCMSVIYAPDVCRVRPGSPHCLGACYRNIPVLRKAYSECESRCRLNGSSK